MGMMGNRPRGSLGRKSLPSERGYSGPTIVTELVQTSNLKYLAYMLEQSKREEYEAAHPEERGSMHGTLASIMESTHESSRKGGLGGDSVRSVSDANFDDDRAVQRVKPSDTNLDYLFRPNFVSGGVYLSNLSDRLLTKSVWQPQTTSVVHTLVNGDSSEQGVWRKLQMVAVKDEWHGFFFKDVFTQLLEEDEPMLCIAMLRGRDQDGKHGGNPLPYVYTVPDAGAVVRKGDQLFVLKVTAHQGAHQVRGAASARTDSVSSMTSEDGEIEEELNPMTNQGGGNAVTSAGGVTI